MRRRATNSARFYVSKASGLKGLTREELTEALQADESLLPQIVRQGSALTGIVHTLQSRTGTMIHIPLADMIHIPLADMAWAEISQPTRTALYVV